MIAAVWRKSDSSLIELTNRRGHGGNMGELGDRPAIAAAWMIEVFEFARGRARRITATSLDPVTNIPRDPRFKGLPIAREVTPDEHTAIRRETIGSIRPLTAIELQDGPKLPG